MDNVITKKRGLIFILVAATVIIFVGLIWLIATYFPDNLSGFSNPSLTATMVRVEMNCTYPVAYWVEHPELYPNQIVLGSEVFQEGDIHEALTGSDQDLNAQLRAQLIGAYLNTSSGADQGLIETTLFKTYGWLIQHTDGNPLTASDLEVGARYFSLLEAYNLGLAGVPSCEGIPTPGIRASIVVSVTSTFTITFTPSATATPTPTETATATSQVVTPFYTVRVPSQTPSKTTEEPGGQAPTATHTVQPPATHTPRPTTEVPSPTDTPTFPPTEVTPTFPPP